VLSLLKDANIGMMVTRHVGGEMHARPMGTNHAEFDGVLWYLTSLSSEKIEDIETLADVVVTYADPARNHYVSITGEASVIRDRAKVKEHWFEAARTWFPDGPDDPDVGLIRVDVTKATYWDAPSSTMIYAYGYVKSLVTGKPPKGGEEGIARY
jgi:general stress protein 26